MSLYPVSLPAIRSRNDSPPRLVQNPTISANPLTEEEMLENFRRMYAGFLGDGYTIVGSEGVYKVNLGPGLIATANGIDINPGTPGLNVHPLLDARIDIDTAAYMPTTGDMIVSSGGVWDGLPAGAEGQVLKMVGGIPGWGTGTNAAHPLMDGADNEDTEAHTPVKGDMIVANDTNWDYLSAGSDYQVLSMDPVSGYPSWKPETLLDGKIHSDTSNSAAVAGAIVYAHGTPAKWDKLAPGTDDQVLTMSPTTGLPEWSPGTHLLLDGKINSDTVATTVGDPVVAGDMIVANAGAIWDKLPAGLSYQVLNIDGTTDAPKWASEKLLDGKIHSDTVAHTPTAGDMIVGKSTGGNWDVLAKGADSTVLTIDPATHMPKWNTPSGGGAITNAFDFWVNFTQAGTVTLLATDLRGMGIQAGIGYQADTIGNANDSWSGQTGATFFSGVNVNYDVLITSYTSVFFLKLDGTTGFLKLISTASSYPAQVRVHGTYSTVAKSAPDFTV